MAPIEVAGAGQPIAVPVDRKPDAEKLDWSDLGLWRTHAGGMNGDRYVPADVVEDHRSDLKGVALVLAQDGNSDNPPEWHLHQDFVLAVGLKREGDNGLRPKKDMSRSQGSRAIRTAIQSFLKFARSI
jgi:hypothetical protein